MSELRSDLEVQIGEVRDQRARALRRAREAEVMLNALQRSLLRDKLFGQR